MHQGIERSLTVAFDAGDIEKRNGPARRVQRGLEALGVDSMWDNVPLFLQYSTCSAGESLEFEVRHSAEVVDEQQNHIVWSELHEGAVFIIRVKTVLEHVRDQALYLGHRGDLVKTRFVVDTHAQNVGTIWHASVVLATGNMTVVEGRADSHAVIVDVLAN